MKQKEFDCTYAEEHDLAPRYLSGQLSAADAEAFEAHYFACDRCWSEVHQGGEIRASMDTPAFAGTMPRPRQGASDASTLLAAAAAVVFLALGALQLSRRPDVIVTEPAYRGGSALSLRLEIATSPGGQIAFSWPVVEDARTYVLQVLASDGVTVWKAETGATNLKIKRNELPAPRPGISFLARVEALNTMRFVVAKSDLTPVSNP